MIVVLIVDTAVAPLEETQLRVQVVLGIRDVLHDPARVAHGYQHQEELRKGQNDLQLEEAEAAAAVDSHVDGADEKGQQHKDPTNIQVITVVGDNGAGVVLRVSSSDASIETGKQCHHQKGEQA